MPWFTLLALRAHTKGVRKDFLLFNGIRSRILRTFVALGIMVVFIRLAMQEFDPHVLLTSFLGYYSTLSLLAIFFAFIHFNYYEHDLTEDIRERYDDQLGGGGSMSEVQVVDYRSLLLDSAKSSDHLLLASGKRNRWIPLQMQQRSRK